MNPIIESVQPLYPSPAFYQTVTLEPYSDKSNYRQKDTVSFQFPANACIVPNSLKLEFDVQAIKSTPVNFAVGIQIPNVTGAIVDSLYCRHPGDYTVTVPAGNYASVAAFLTALVTAWQAVDGDLDSISYNATTNQLTFELDPGRAAGDWTIYSFTGSGTVGYGYGTLAWLLGFDISQDLVIPDTQDTVVTTLPHTFFQRVGTSAPAIELSGNIDVNGTLFAIVGTFNDAQNLALAMQAAVQRTGATMNYFDLSFQVVNNVMTLKSPSFFAFNPLDLRMTIPFSTSVSTFSDPAFELSSGVLTDIWRFDLLNPRLQTNILSCFERAFLRYNYDLVIEDVQYFGRIQRLLTEISSSADIKSSEGNVLSNIANWFVRLDIGQRLTLEPQRFSVTLPLGFFSNMIPLKYMMDRALMLDLTLRPDAECFIADVPTNFQYLNYSNFRLVYDAVELPPDQDAMLYKQIQADGLKLPFPSWTWDVNAFSNVHEELNFRFPQIGCALFMLSAIYADQAHLIMDSDCTFSLGQPSLLLPYGTSNRSYSVATGVASSFLQKYQALVDELIIPERGVNVHKSTVQGVSNAAKAYHHLVKTMSKCCPQVGEGLNTYRWANLRQQTLSGSFSPDFSTVSPSIGNRDIDTVNQAPFVNTDLNACPQFCMAVDFINPETKQIGTNLDEKKVVQLHLDFNQSYVNSGCSLHSFLCHQRTFVLMDLCNAAVLH